jgi:hypothetical protein
MRENAEYCDGQDFQMVFVATFYRLWQCKRCAYEFTQLLTDTNPPVIPAYHPKPIPIRFTVSDEQRARLKAFIEEEPCA